MALGLIPGTAKKKKIIKHPNTETEGRAEKTLNKKWVKLMFMRVVCIGLLLTTGCLAFRITGGREEMPRWLLPKPAANMTSCKLVLLLSMSFSNIDSLSHK
jgi:hypothetical protein